MDNRDRLFWRFVLGMFAVMILFGIATAIVILAGNDKVGLRMLTIFSSMFLAVLGLGSGYLLGQNQKKD